MSDTAALAPLLDRVVRGLFAASPAAARAAGDHTYDGVLGSVGSDAVQARMAELDNLLAEIDAIDRAGLDDAQRADLATARALTGNEHFHLAELRDPATDPQWAAYAGADVWSYVARPYAPVPERAEALCRHLEQLPDWLDAAAGLLDGELAAGPRQVGLDTVRGFASFYRSDVRTALGDLGDPALARRLDAALEAGAGACERMATRVEATASLADAALGPDRFAAMLEAQEGVHETAAALRTRVDAELERLEARGAEVAASIGAASLTEAFVRMEERRSTASTLVADTAGMLAELRRFWEQRDVVTLPQGVDCRVIPTPSFMSWVTAAYESPGPLDPDGLEHHYFITTVDPTWSATQAEQWLTHLNLPCLENISVHEVLPGHFVHAVAALGHASLVRKIGFFSGFGEGWAHYTELLGIEQGLAEGRPLLELAMIQDALLRVCRFSATVSMHCEGGDLESATRLFEEHAHIPRLAAEREALRGTHDPMYLVYTYGKLEILRWREELSRRPGFSEKAFHDRMLRCGYAPLAAVAEYTAAGFPAS